MRFCLIVIVSIFHITSAFSQESRCHKWVPFFQTFNTKTLAYALTHNLKDDSAKVFAIHCWITHHIKYDVKKSRRFDYRVNSTRKILRRRKAICKGYSDLFDELCKYAKITSTSIPGYDKNEKVDLNDSFYLDEHIWNAVYIHGEWKLIDACWDAGYVKYFKRPFIWKILKAISNGKWDKLVLKPHFVRSPSTAYYFKNGAEFIYDHIPVDPLWQLVQPIYPVDSIEKDSAFYFKNNTPKPWLQMDSSANKERQFVAALSEKEALIYLGPVSNSYNYKNHYHLGISKYLKAMDLFIETNPKTTDTLAMIRHCDTLISKFNNSKMHFDSNNYYLKIQKSELQTTNQLKKRIISTQNKELIRSTYKVIITVKKGKLIATYSKRSIKRLNKTNKNRLERLVKSERFNEAKVKKVYSSIDSLNSVRTTTQLQDSLQIINLKIKAQFLFLDSLYKVYRNKFEQCSKRTETNKGITKSLIITRMFFFDDLDYEIRPTKDSLFKHKFINDALLFDSNHVFIMKSLYRELFKVKADYRKLYHYHKLLLNEYVKLKKYNANLNDLSVAYNRNLKNYKSELITYEHYLRINKQHFSGLKRLCKKQLKRSKKEKQFYKVELDLEKMIYSFRSDYINNHYIALVNLSQDRISEIERKKRKIETLKNKYTKIKK